MGGATRRGPVLQIASALSGWRVVPGSASTLYVLVWLVFLCPCFEWSGLLRFDWHLGVSCGVEDGVSGSDGGELGGYEGWDDVTRRIVDGVVASIKREYFMGYVERMREIGASSEKLVFIYLALFQPQTSLSIRYGTGLHRNTVSDALETLRVNGYVRLDGGALWWTI